MLVTCFSTARSVTKSRSAIAWFDRPSAISSSTSRSRGGQLLERVVGALPTHELADDGGVERRAAVGHAAHGRAELLEIGDAVLEQVADALGARLEERHRVPGLDVLREQEHADRGMPLADLAGGPKALVRVRRRHADVDDRDVGLVHRDVAEQVLRVARLRDDLEPRFLEQPRHAFPEEDRVVGDDDAASVAELRDRPAKRREVARQPVGEHLVDALGIGKALQPVRPEISRLDPRGERRGCRRQQDLPAVPGRGDPRRADDVEAGVALLAEMRNTRVEAHPHLDGEPVGPGVVTDPLLSGEGGLERGLHFPEDGRELVARRVDLRPARRRDLGAQQAPHVRDDAGVRAARGLHEPRRALDVGRRGT